MRPRVGLATCAALPELDPDDRLVLEPLRARGADVAAAVWDDPTIDWSAFDLVVIRSTWDYTARRDAFLAWTASAPRLLNPPDVVAWNTDKRYLAELEAAGLPVVPTAWISPGDPVRLPAAGVHVLKPAVGAGSVDAGRFSLHDVHEAELARAHVERLLAANQTVMVQPYLEMIDARGETGLIFIGGEFSHAMAKGAMLTGERELVGGMYKAETIEARVPSAAEVDLATRALATIPGGPSRLLYARVDLVPGPGGSTVIIELELTEPSLFMSTAPGSERRFAAAVFASL
jgi:hypothetical protein